MNRTRWTPLLCAATLSIAALAILARQSSLLAQEPAAPVAGTPSYLPVISNAPDPFSEPPATDPPEQLEPVPSKRAAAVVDAIFADGFDSGNLSRWPGSVIDGGDLAAAAEARIVGTHGLRVQIDDGILIYALDETPRLERRLHARLHVDPNSITMAEGDVLVVFAGYSQGNARLVQIELVRKDGGYALRAGLINDANEFAYTSHIAISDAPHAVEIDWVSSPNNSSRSGSLIFWVDGSERGRQTGIDNNWRPVERVRLGALMSVPTGTHGVLYLDSYESRRVTYIGPGLSSSPAATPTLTPTPTNTPVPPTGAPTATPTNTPTATPTATPVSTPVTGDVPIVFVSRRIPTQGSIYMDAAMDMPGVGPHSRFRVAAPGSLLVREPNGQIRTLINGASPTAASLNLIDVNAPDVSYDGTTIVFAGLPQGNYGSGPVNNPDAWRLYAIRADGTALRQITRSDMNLNYSQFGAAAGGLDSYDDTDPAWLPDGRIVFSSTRWPSFAHYSGVRTTNLYVVNADGSNLHRITSERNGADRPMVDPLTGKIVYARWWRNHRFAIDSMATIVDSRGGYVQNLGLTTDRTNHVGGGDFLWRNMWHAASINPDGTDLQQWAGPHHRDDASHMYGGGFLPNGDLIANYFPMSNMTEAAGFGGLRRYSRGGTTYTSVLGVTSLTLDYVISSNPTSFGIFKGSYATEPAALPNGKLVISWAPDVNQDYGLYTINPDGSGLTPLYNSKGTTELRAKPIMARPRPPVLPDTVSTTASLLPPLAAGPYTQDGTFVFDALNVYGNGPVDTIVSDAPDVGSAARIRFFTDFQRTSPGSFPYLDWPILLADMAVAPDGSVRNVAPANLPLFEQLRSANGTVPFNGGSTGSAGHVAGLNYGRPGSTQRCVGCHAGHTEIPVPANDADAKFSNVAPSANVTVSSSRDPNQNRGLVDRRVMKGEIWRYWNSAPGQTSGQWVQLTFPVPITVRRVVLYNPRTGGEANSSIAVSGTRVRLFSDAAGTAEVGNATSGALSVSGTAVNFADMRARVVRIEITGVSGTFYGTQLASLAEVEVIARAEAP